MEEDGPSHLNKLYFIYERNTVMSNKKLGIKVFAPLAPEDLLLMHPDIAGL